MLDLCSISHTLFGAATASDILRSVGKRIERREEAGPLWDWSCSSCMKSSGIIHSGVVPSYRVGGVCTRIRTSD